VGQVDLRNPFIFAAMRSWKPAFNQPVEAQQALYRSVEFRNAFRADLTRPRLVFSGRWETIEIHEVNNPALKSLEKKTVAEIARKRGQDGVDTFLDIALEDELKTQYIIPLFNSNEEGVRELITDPRTMIGLFRVYLRPYRTQLAFVIGLLLVQAIANLYLPDLNADIINNGVAKGDVGYIWRIGAVMLALTIVVGILAIIGVYYASRASMGLGRDVRRDMRKHT